MAGLPGIAAKFFATFGAAGISVKAIAQGSSERNISAVIAREDATRALRAAHSGFYLSANTISVGLVGPGHVGSMLLDQMAAQATRLRNEFSLDFRIRGLATSSRMLLAERSVDLSSWREALNATGSRSIGTCLRRTLTLIICRMRPWSIVVRVKTFHIVTSAGLVRVFTSSRQIRRPKVGRLIITTIYMPFDATMGRIFCTKLRSAPRCRLLRHCAISVRPVMKSEY